MSTIDNVPAQNPHAVLAAASVVFLAIVAVLALPAIDEPWGVRLWFPAAYLACSVVLEGLIALFLALQVLAGAPTRALGWLAGGYAFTAIVAMAQFLTFPGILDEPLAAPTEGNTAVWLWILWHAGFPCFVLLAVGAKLKPAGLPRVSALPQRLINLFPMAVGIAAALAGAALLIGGPDFAPALAQGDDYSRLSHSFIGGALVALNIFALATLISRTRLRDIISLWLAVAMFAFMLDIVLSMAAMERYNAGWYIGRCVSIVSAAALMVALMIEHFHLHRDAEIRATFHEQEAMHDSLTGVFNRRYLMRQLTEELGRAQRYRYPISVLLLDLDHFKRINDQYGHAAGDECLRALAQVLGERVHRHGDFSARYGGEEFVVVLLETGLAGAVDVAEEIRRRIENLHGRGATPCPMTTSIGVATADSSAQTSPEALLAEADACLYRAKQQGRNRVVWPQKPADLHSVNVAPA